MFYVTFEPGDYNLFGIFYNEEDAVRNGTVVRACETLEEARELMQDLNSAMVKKTVQWGANYMASKKVISA